MSRRKSARVQKVCGWLSANADCREFCYSQVGDSLMKSQQFQSLSYGARELYLCMALRAKGAREFTFPLAVAENYGFASTSFRRYAGELVRNGFIYCQSGRTTREPNLYSFAFEWKKE